MKRVNSYVNILMAKFNKFDTLLETAFSHYSNGGFREGSPVRIKPEFLKHPYFKSHYSGDELFCNWLKDLMERKYFFFIKRVVGHGAMQDVKDSNDNEGAGDAFLILKLDPRTVNAPTELGEFTVPADFGVVEVLNFGGNLPPVQSVPNRYELPIGYQKPQPVQIDITINNQPTDKDLAKGNTAIPASPAQAAKFDKPQKLKLRK
jgi:hypothetical protein